MTRHAQKNWHTLLCGIATAAIVFSWSLATSAGSSSATMRGNGASARAVGSGLRFSNPFLLAGQDASFPAGGNVASDPDGFDLGDATFGSQFVRYLGGLGGVQPFLFASSNLPTGVTLDPTGRLSGAVPAGVASPAKFNASITDPSGQARTGTFALQMFDSATQPFRFALDRLPDGQIGLDYITNVSVINGSAATTFSIVPGSVAINGTPLRELEFAGLTLFADGTLAGRPLNPGTLTFTAQASSNGVIALNRAATALNQTFTISIANEDTVESVLAVVNATLRAGRPFRDQFNLQAIINSDGLRSRDFGNMPFILRVAGRTFSTVLNSTGQVRSGDLRVQLSALTGKLKVTLRNQDFSTLFPPLLDNNKYVTVQIQIGDSFLGTEIVRMAGRSRRGITQLKYRLGKNIQLGGLFQITSLTAGDFFEGTAFRTRFLISHVRGNSDITFGQGVGATVHIGPGFHQTVPLRRGRGSYPPDGVRKLRVNTNNKIADIETYLLPQSETGIPPAPQANGQVQTFLFGLELDTTTLFFHGEASRRIFPVFFR